MGYNLMGCCAGVNSYEGAEFVRSSLARDQDVIIDFTALQQVFAFSHTKFSTGPPVTVIFVIAGGAFGHMIARRGGASSTINQSLLMALQPGPCTLMHKAQLHDSGNSCTIWTDAGVVKAQSGKLL